jgi:hypothetical protein
LTHEDPYSSYSYDDATNTLTWSITFQNLSSAPIAAHFHGPASPSEDAGVEVGIGDLTSPSVGNAVLSAAQEEDLLQGLWYINYHTTACGGGEIRGQVSGSGVGGVTELSGTEGGTPLNLTKDDGGNTGMLAGIAAAVAAMSLAGAGGAILVGRRLIK